MITLQKNTTFVNNLAKVVLLAIPTLAIMYFLFWNVGSYYTIIQNQSTKHTIYFGTGLLSALLFYAFRFRFITTTPILFLLLYLLYKSMDTWSANFGEFDAFFYTIQCLLFAILFSAGWLVGWALQRLKYFPIFFSTLLLVASIFIVAKTGGFNYLQFIKLFIPILAYCLYLLFTTQQLKNYQANSILFWKKYSIRLIAFLSLLLLFSLIIVAALRNDIEGKIMESKGTAKGNKTNGVSTVNKNNETEMTGGLSLEGNSGSSKNKELIFCAHIENFFEGTDVPNPLYMTTYHYTKFDTLSETFERDPAMPFNDEFLPEPGNMPLFSIAKDSTKIKNALSKKMRRVIEVEVFNKKLSPTTFVAPSTSFEIQTLTVDKNFQKEFKNAYRSKSYVSKLNSAYFIYNALDASLKAFQEQRFSVLRNAPNYSTIDKTFMDYYTFFPSANTRYAKIKQLALQLAKNKTTTVDKVIAVRDYFLQRDALNKPMYKYSDNPGIPGMPSASKLNYFMFETKKGYCAYYSAATLFLLRAMNVPCRITCGFLTEDRASKNKGWYWFYGNQSHAWVEVYFPEYGWIDFDTTVGDEENKEPGKPDGTPPSPPEKAPLAITLSVLNVDTANKIMSVETHSITFKDVPFVINNVTEKIAFEKARIIKDTLQIPITDVQKGDEVVCVSYNKKWNTFNAANANVLIEKLGSPISVDEVYTTKKPLPTNKKQPIEKEKKLMSAKQIFTIVGLVLISLLLLFALLPSVCLQYYKWQAKKSTGIKKLNATYYYIRLYMHQLGYGNIEKLAPLQYAQQYNVQLQHKFVPFITDYVNTKYAKNPIIPSMKSSEEILIAKKYFQAQIPLGKYFKKIINPITFINYLIK